MMKNNSLFKLTSFILVFVIIFFSSAVFAEDENIILSDVENKYIKVGILYGDTSAEAVKLQSSNGFILADLSNDGWGPVMELFGYNELYVIFYPEYNMSVLMNEDATLLVPILEDQGVMGAGTDLDDIFITVNGKKYRDGVSLTVDENGRFNVANYISVEHYLWGVLNSEIGSNYPEEAIKAQAVAARTFTYAHFGKHMSKYGFDLCCTSDCQVYGGVSAERQACTDACRATEGIIMRYGDEIINAVYYAYSGGYTLNSEDAWTSPIPYLRSIKDEYSPEYNWSVSYSFDEIKGLLLSKGIDVGDIDTISLNSVTSYGAVISLKITGTSDSAVISKSNLKSIFSLKSQIFDIKASDAAAETESTYVYVLDGYENTVKVALSDLIVYDGEKNISGLEADLSSVSQTENTAPITSATAITFAGKGYGHGVGMSQTGARNMAREGKSFQDILNYYYTGISIESYER